MSSPEQRRFPRKPLAVQFVGRDAEGEGQLIFEGADISPGGAFLKSDLLLEPGEALNVEFRVPGLTRLLRAQGRVAWVRRFPAEGEPGGMGLSFLAMTDEDKHALSGYLAGL